MVKTAYFIIIPVLFIWSTIKAQDNAIVQPRPLFQSDEILNLDLKADFKTVFSVTDDSTYFPAAISFKDTAGVTNTIDIKIRTRGKTRRQKDYCSFPPLRLNFPKKETKDTPFEGQNAIKLVTHCSKADHYEQNTMIEYLIYKTFNVMTDSSLKVRPAMINYIFDGKRADTVRKFAFFIEREKHLADRLKGNEMKPASIHPDRLSASQTCLVDMFQYMIGNTDYSVYELHNIILVRDSSRNFKAVPIPYDFDWSGLVSAVYAVPHPTIDTKSVTDRLYRGLKREPEVVDRTIAVFNAKKEEIYGLFENFELLYPDEKKKALKYLDEFYGIINDDRLVKVEFFDKARKVE